jgi:hypothetical protein
MLKALGVGLIVFVASASGAAAQEMCGADPIAPAIPSAVDIKQKAARDAEAAKHGAFVDIRRWQSELKSFRDCINATVTADNRKIGEIQRSDKPDKDKIKSLQQEIVSANHAYDLSTDEEERIVNEFNGVSVAYCTRNDVDKSSCPKR